MCVCSWGTPLCVPSHPPLWSQTVPCEVFSYGSFPFKAYLPDGDIDLTVLSNQTNDEELARKVLDILNNEGHKKDAKYEVKDTLFINAEVKIIKCRVHDLMVDISFNQIGGLRTLCFLYMVDNRIGRGHLFKRAIILIKAWCYYESRLLGGNHGLISTYGLEILIMYIFNIYHKSVNGPLQALYLFLDYFERFDWDKYSVSVLGPVVSSSLPQVETSQPIGSGALLDEEFMKGCLHVLALNSVDQGSTSGGFPIKFFNIVDPLRRDNNLGRSVSKGNLYRISCAFSYGARKLGEMLRQPPSLMPQELNKFFMNTLERCGTEERRPDVISSLPEASSEIDESPIRIDSVAWALETLVAMDDAEAGPAASRSTSGHPISNAGDLDDRLVADFTSLHITEEDVNSMIGQLHALIGSGSSSVGADEVEKQFHDYCHDLMLRRRSPQQPALETPRADADRQASPPEAEAILREESTAEAEAILRVESGDRPSPNAWRERTGGPGRSTTVATNAGRSTPMARYAETAGRSLKLNSDEFPPLRRRQ